MSKYSTHPFLLVALMAGACGDEAGGDTAGEFTTKNGGGGDANGDAYYTATAVFDGLGEDMGDLPITMSAKLDPVNGGHYDTIVSGVVGETISLAAPAEWDMVIGPPTGETDNSNYPTLPVMEGEDGWRWIYPRVTYALNPGDEVVEEITLNAYADGMWDCVDNDDYESSGEVDMSRGEELDLPFGEVKVEGIRLTVADEHADDPDWDADGEFTGPASIEVWIKSPLGEWTFWCEARGQ